MPLSDFTGPKRPFIIADVGSNWCIETDPAENKREALSLIAAAAAAGAHAVKFQLFTDLELYGMAGPDKWALPRGWLPELAAYAGRCGIEFMCTPFSPEGVAVVDPFVNIHKVASCEMKHVGILDAMARTGKPILISTGGATGIELLGIARYLQAHGLNFDTDFTFLQCVAAYPASADDYNLRVLSECVPVDDTTGAPLARYFSGVSDHTGGFGVAAVAVGLGATVFEKHLRSYDWAAHETPDQEFAIGPAGFYQYGEIIAHAFDSLGSGIKVPAASERDVTLRHRRRLKVTAEVKQGAALIYGTNFGIYRSIVEDAEADAPERFQMYDGGIAKRDLYPGDPVFRTTVETFEGEYEAVQ